MKKSFILTIIATISIAFGVSQINAEHKMVCVPMGNYLGQSLSESLRCYYHFGYQTPKEFCFIRFDMTPGSGVTLGGWRARNNPNTLPVYFAGKCRKAGYQGTERIIFTSQEGQPEVDVNTLKSTQQTKKAEDLATAIGASSVTRCSGGGAAACAKEALGSSLSPKDNP